MARSNLKPVTIAGIEFDALIDESKTLAATIPTYPVEEGFPVSDTIILEPLSVQMTLYVSATPVTWLYRHGSNAGRVQAICDSIENLWLNKELVKIVTTDAIYTNMGITSIGIKKSREIGYAREISLSAQKVRVTARKVGSVPAYDLKGGATGASAGTAATSTSSGMTSGGSSGSGSGSGGGSDAGNKRSILYGIADGMGLM